MKVFSLITLLLIGFAFGCSGGTSVDVNIPEAGERQASASHGCWGMWQFTIDKEKQTLEAVPMRGALAHVNVLPLLEPPPFLNLTLEYLQFNGNIITADVGLHHPFTGLTEFTGFDVNGIFITNGDISGFHDTSLVMPGPGATRLLNPDGYTRWWNPAEFPHDNGIFSYVDGLLGAPDSFANFNCTLNGYKSFCDELGVNDGLDVVDPVGRAMFSPGAKNVRRYIIEMGTPGLVFNYAVDANWSYPQGGAPWTAPDDFGEAASRPEAWRIAVNENLNTLFNDGLSSGGELHLSIDVYDWYNADMNTLLVESPGNFTPVASGPASGGGVGYSTYTVDITTASPQAAGDIDLLISVVSEQPNFQSFITGTNTTAYFIHTTTVSGSSVDYIQVTSPNGGESWAAGSTQEITWNSAGSTTDVLIEYSKDDFATDIHQIVASTADDGSFLWDVPADPTSTARVRVTDVDSPVITDESDADFTITLDAVYVDDSNTSGIEDGTQANPYNTIQEGLAAAPAGYYVLVDDSGNDYNGPVTLKGDVILYSLNWDISDGGDQAAIFLAGTSTIVNGANNATIEGFKVYGGSRYGIYINTVDTSVINCLVTDIDTADSWSYCYGIRVDNSVGSIIKDCTVSQIAISGNWPDLFGIYLNNSPITVSGCTIQGVNATGYWLDPGAGIYATNCTPSGSQELDIHGNAISNITGSYYAYNLSGIYVDNSDNSLVYNNAISGIAGDSYSNPRGIAVNNCDGVQVYNNLVNGVIGGSYDSCFGVRVMTCNNISLVNNTIYDVFKGGYYGVAYGLHISDDTTGFDGRNNIVNYIRWNGFFTSSWAVYGPATAVWEYNDVIDAHNGLYTGGIVAGTGCISSPPMFVSTTLPFDFNLQTGSPCIDTGDPDPACNDTDSSRNNMGCYGGPAGGW